MDQLQLITNFLFSIVSLFCFGITGRAFYLYTLTRNDLLFTVALSMGTIGVGTVVAVISPMLHAFNGLWGSYLAPSVGFTFVFLASIVRTEEQMRVLKLCHILTTLIFLMLVTLAAFFPSPPPSDHTVDGPLNILRLIISLIVFFRYTVLFAAKETRFSLLMCLAFMIISVSFGTIVPSLFLPPLTVSSTARMLLNISGVIRVFGYGTLLGAFSLK